MNYVSNSVRQSLIKGFGTLAHDGEGIELDEDVRGAWENCTTIVESCVDFNDRETGRKWQTRATAAQDRNPSEQVSIAGQTCIVACIAHDCA